MNKKNQNSQMKIKVRKWLPSYVTVTRVVRPKKGAGYRRPRNNKHIEE